MEPPTKPTAPVMDVKAPPSGVPATEALAEPPAQTPEDVKEAREQAEKNDKKVVTAAKSKTKTPKKRSYVGLAIFATMVIVVALAALATYAYLKQNHQL